jgi:ketosteroid isomerase-like protein
MSNIELIKSVYTHINQKEIGNVLDYFSAGVNWHEAENSLFADGNPYVGREEVAGGVLQRLDNTLESFSWLPEHFIEGTNVVVVEGRLTGVMRATGKPVDTEFAHIWQLLDGQIKRFRQYTDTYQWRMAAVFE